MKELKAPFKIVNNTVDYELADFREKFVSFKTDNEGQEGEAVFKIAPDSVEYFQHKWYRGYLIPAIARDSYDNDEFEAHIELKKRFLIQSVSKYSDIPDGHQNRCFPLYYQNVNKETGEVKDVLYGYVPSTGDLTYFEMKEYILEVERFMAEMGIQFSIDKDELPYRNKAFKVRTGQSSKVPDIVLIGA